jgi:hypothetical protein
MEDGGLPSSCLSPCHGFNGIVEQWKTSTHYAAFISNIDTSEVASWTGATACGNCHATDAISYRVAGQVGTIDGGVVTNLSHGQLEYKLPATGALTESTYVGNAKVASVTCTTCHSVTDATDPHRTGKPYADGDFPLRVPTGKTDTVTIEKSPTVGTITGTQMALGTSNACVWCHRSRKDVTNYIPANLKVTNPNWGPHEGPQADVFSGQGGYHFANQTYGTSTHQQKLVCVDCHMPDVATNQNAPNHSFYAQLSACQSCHAGATSFDIVGGQSEITAAMFELQKDLNNVGLLTRDTAAPYGPLNGTMLTDAAFDLDKTRAGAYEAGTMTPDQAGALYNYIIVARGGALGVHNPKYVRQLIYDSIVATTGAPPVTLLRP